MTPRPDIFTVRPSGENLEDSKKAIREELEAAGLKISYLEEGITQPDGSVVWYAYLKDEDTTKDLLEDASEYRD